MKKLTDRLDELDKEINEAEQVLANVKTLPYYRINRREAEQTLDWKNALNELYDLYSKRYNLLNSIQIQLNKELSFTSMAQANTKRDQLKTA